ncbi:MAG: DUF192 domain-containing protein [Dongiaceae bacterium]
MKTKPPQLGPLLAIAVLLGVMGFGLYYQSASEASVFPITQISVHTDQGPQLFQVELALTPQAQAQGLMFRKQVEAGKGMLFVFPQNQPLYFWMKNTLIPLDMVFIDDKWMVRHIHPNAKPKDETLIPSLAPAKFVLEIAGGESERLGIKKGDRVLLDRVP